MPILRILCLLFPATLAPLLAAEEKLSFNRDIRPILSDKCFACHGFDEKHRDSGRRLDTPEGAYAETDGIVAIKPSDLAKSDAWVRIISNDRDEVMPPPKSHKTLSKAEKETIRKWIEQGAAYQKHWAFEKPERPANPLPDQHPVDGFIRARLAKEKLSPAPETDRATLLRRVTLDLTGLPPTTEEVRAFLADSSPNAYEKQVDRLLASPRYGEHMAVWWCDAARYGDSNGYQNDFLRDQWRWRDWVIEAFNRNLPYDQFTIEQIGGDLLPHATLDQRIATGFHRNNRTVTEAGSISEEWRAEYVVDRVSTTGQVWLGLTLGCARCHDHKFDPVSQKEFFQMAAFFNSVAEVGVVQEKNGNVAPMITTPTPDQQAKLAELDTALVAAQAAAKSASAKVAAEQAEWERGIEGKPVADVVRGLVWRAPLEGTLATGGPGTVNSPNLIWIGGGEPKWKRSPFGLSLDATTKEGFHAQLKESPEVDGTKPFSVSAWVRLDDVKQPAAVLSRMSEADAFRGFDLTIIAGKPTFHLIHHWTDNALKVTAEQSLLSGHWHHVAVTYDGSRKAKGVSLYLDGRAQKVTVDNDTLKGSTVTDEPMRLGLRTKSLPLSGEMRDARFYNLPLEAKEVLTLSENLHLQLASIPSAQRSPEGMKELASWYRATRSGIAKDAIAKEEAAKREKKVFEDKIPTTMVMAELPKPRETYVFKRGAYDQKGEVVTHGTPAALPPFPAGSPMNRLGLGQWLVAKDNPLTARVLANRLWERFFGIGIVATSDDFGSQSEPPSHPELLDWLACELHQPTLLPAVGGKPAQPWDLKAFQKMLVMTAAYRQSSATTPALTERDPNNRLLARGARFRLPAEVIRDQALAVSGLLVEKLGGPSVKPYQPPNVWEEMIIVGANKYTQDTGDALFRRTLYTLVRRTAQQPSLAIFDAPNREICTIKRGRTNTPLQALGLMNDKTYVEASRHLAQRMLTEGGATPATRLTHGFRAVTARDPRAEELRVLERGLAARLAVYQQNADSAKKLLSIGEAKSPANFDAIELAAYTTAASVILNLDEVITHQ